MALTKREKEILELKAKGLSDPEIGRQLHMSHSSVWRSSHCASMKIERARADLDFANKVGY